MENLVLFEQKSRGHLWRLEITTYKGRTFGNWRKWFWSETSWKPTREGCVIPLERLPELEGALSDCVRQKASERS